VSLFQFRAFFKALRANPTVWLLLVVAAYVLYAPGAGFAPSLTWHDRQRIAQLAALSIVLFMALAALPLRRQVEALWAVLPKWARGMLSLALLLGVISALLAPLQRWAMLEVGLCALLLAGALGVAAGRRSFGNQADAMLVVIFYALAIAYTVKTQVTYLGMLTIGAGQGLPFNVCELYTGFSNIRFFGQYQTMLLPFLLLPAMWWANNTRQRVLLAIVPAIWWMLVVASGTRGTWVALMAGVMVVALFGGQSGRRWIKWQVAGLVSGLLCYAIFILGLPGLLEQPATFLHRTNDIVPLSAREVIWASSIEFTKHHPWLGIGPMHFAYYPNAVAAHPHNFVLQFMCEWGIPAALLITAVFAAGGLAFARFVKRTTGGPVTETSLVAVALLAAITGATVQALIDGVLVMPVSQMTLVLICGWAIGLYFEGRPTPASVGVFEKRLCAALVVLSAGAVAYGVWPEISHLEQRQEAYFEAHPSSTLLLPRFWIQGWFNPEAWPR